MAFHKTLSLVALLAVAGYVSAALSPLEIVCTQVDTAQFCKLIQVAIDYDDSISKMVANPAVVMTLLAPTDRGLNITTKTMSRALGVDSVEELAAKPALTARFIKSHVILGVKSDTRTWRSGQTLTNSLTVSLIQIEGLKMNLYLKGPLNTAKIVRRNLLSDQGRVQIIEVPIYPTKQ